MVRLHEGLKYLKRIFLDPVGAVMLCSARNLYVGQLVEVERFFSAKGDLGRSSTSKMTSFDFNLHHYHIQLQYVLGFL